MIEGLLALSLSLSAQAAPNAVTLDKTSITPQGTQDVVVKVARPSMVHVAVDSEVGVACTLIDHLRGPFFDDGVVGKTSCNSDVLLDQGLYKLRLTAPGASPKKKAKGPAEARVDVRAFSDVDAPLVLLPGRSSTVKLPPTKQVTRWLRVPSQQEIVVDVYGRTAGRLALWRDGQWVETSAPRSTVERPLPGRPIHHQRLQAVVDPGDYALVVYGADVEKFTEGVDDDTVFVAYDVAPASSSRSEVFTIPAWGVFSVKTPLSYDDGVSAFLSVDGKRTDVVSLSAEAVIVDEKLGPRRSSSTSCSIDPAAPVAACTLTSSRGGQRATVFEVRGAPGTTGRLVWLPAKNGVNAAVGDARSDLVVNVDGTDAVTVVGLPQSIDAAPLGCALDRLDDKGVFVSTIARDLPSVSFTQAWKRKFNTDATTTALWLNIEKPGVYSISGNDKLGASCEVFTLDENASTSKKRVGEGKDGACDHKLPLPAGPIEVRFYGGKPGIQELRVGVTGVAALVGTDAEAPMKGGCTFTGLLASGKARYRVRTNGAAGATLRAVYGKDIGLRSMFSVGATVDPGRPLSFALDAGNAVQVKNNGPGNFSCALDGKAVSSCETGPLSSPATLTLTNNGTRPTLALLSRTTPPAPSPPLDPWNGAPPRLPLVTDGSTQWFDLDGTKGKSFVVEVTASGLFDIETQGLLSTRCTVRTAVEPSLFSGESNGRGRNCLVESYLKPGRYLVTVDTRGPSKGRAGLSLTSKPAWAGGDLGLGDERFVSVDAGAMARHSFTLKKDMHVDWSIAAQAAGLSCRLDDNDGWPLKKVPHACSGSDDLPAGKYTLNVLPLTVESRRSLKLGEPLPQETLRGDKAHSVALNRRYTAELSDDGKDGFVFVVSADVDVGVVLGGGMQGRIYAADARGKKGDVVAAIAPVGGSGFGLSGGEGVVEEAQEEADGERQDEYGEPEEPAYEGDAEYSEGEEEAEGGYDEGAGRVDDGRAAATLLSATLHQPVAPPPGQRVSLKAGTYLLETEHSRGDVGVAYDLGVHVQQLLPGTTLSGRAPLVVDVKAPSAASGAGAGLVRIKTRGETDVACHLVDDRGVTVAASTGSGADWNCALAVPLSPGATYKLYVDAEVLRPGDTTLIAEFLEAKETGALKDGDSFKLVGKVAQTTVTPPRGKLLDVTLTSSDEFSCAAVDRLGGERVVDRQTGTKRCSLLLWGNDDVTPFNVLVWTADRPASVKVAVSERALSGLGGLFGGKDLDDDDAVEAKVTGRGRFETAPNARCLQKNVRGALVPCPVAASFDPKVDGDTVLVAVARGEKATVPFTERIARLEKRQSDERVLDGRKTVEHQTTTGAALHLVDVQSLPGSSARPACAVEGGAAVVDDARCVAVSGLTTESTLSLWTRPGGAVPVRLVQQSVTPPAAVALVSGSNAVDGVGRFSLPGEPWRLDLAAPADAWVVQLDDADHAVDVCAPAASLKPLVRAPLARCVFRGRGGSVVVARAGADDKGAYDIRADVLRFAAFDEPARLLSGVFELKPRGPARERLRFAASTSERSLRVEGYGVKGCAVHFDDANEAVGNHVAACKVVVPAGVAGDVVVEHDGRAIRATLGKKGDVYGNRFGAASAASGASSSRGPGVSEVLSGASFVRSVDVKSRGVLRMRSTGGVCGVGEGGVVLASEGMGGGCDLRVVVDKGTHQLMVRSFAGAPLTGTLAWTFEPVIVVDEGVGKEVVVQPGEARVFQVSLQGRGELGIGIKVDAEVLDCALLNTNQEVVADGCQIFGVFEKGTYFLRVEAPTDVPPKRFAPVVFGLKGADVDVPDDYLKDFFSRVPRPVTGSAADASKEVH